MENTYYEGMDIASQSCTVTKDGQTVATVSIKFFAMSDTYGVEISGADEDHAFILAIVIILDQLMFNRKMVIPVLS